MKLNTLTPAEGSVKSNKRIGRGQGSGRGGTATRGHNGAQSRSGYKSKGGFEGGQMPLYRRVPKFGFKSPNRVETKPLNLDTIQALVEKLKIDTVTLDTLKENGLVTKNDVVKVLGRGVLTAKVDITVHYFSGSAIAAIEKAGGKATSL